MSIKKGPSGEYDLSVRVDRQRRGEEIFDPLIKSVFKGIGGAITASYFINPQTGSVSKGRDRHHTIEVCRRNGVWIRKY